MKAVNEIADRKVPLMAIDNNLDRLRDKIMFPEKLAKANKILSTAKLPPKKKND